MLPQGNVNPYSAVKITVHGRVQGVGYRYFAKMSATRLGLAGWVRNLPNGTVEVYAEGRKSALESFIAQLRRGPTYSSVEQVELAWLEPKREARSFYIR